MTSPCRVEGKGALWKSHALSAGQSPNKHLLMGFDGVRVVIDSAS